jgi:hypothetical protein
MAFKEDELNQLELVVVKAIAPIQTSIALIDQTLNKKDGVCDKINCLESKVTDLKMFKRQVYAVVGTIQAIGIGIITYLKFNNK